MVKEFEKLKKKFALNNSYFKNRQHNAPNNPFEVLQYYKQLGELPYENGVITENWFYECFCEYQKKAGVYNSQFFTPPSTAEIIAEIVVENGFFNGKLLDACCGFGQLTKALINKGFQRIEAFDCDHQMVEACSDLYDNKILKVFQHDFEHSEGLSDKYSRIVSNPPYEIRELTIFLEFVEKHLHEGGKAILLIPMGFVDKKRPANLAKVLSKFSVEWREPMLEKFERTGANAEIVVLSKS